MEWFCQKSHCLKSNAPNRHSFKVLICTYCTSHVSSPSGNSNIEHGASCFSLSALLVSHLDGPIHVCHQHSIERSNALSLPLPQWGGKHALLCVRLKLLCSCSVHWEQPLMESLVNASGHPSEGRFARSQGRNNKKWTGRMTGVIPST